MQLFEQGSIDPNDAIDRLNSILEEFEILMEEANSIIKDASTAVGDDIIYERWRVYPYNNIMSMLSSPGRYEVAFSSIIEELENATSEEDL